jgi:hypothetical protein
MFRSAVGEVGKLPLSVSLLLADRIMEPILYADRPCIPHIGQLIMGSSGQIGTPNH